KLSEPAPANDHAKPKRSFTVREMLAARANELQTLKPCLLMSPISVSQFLMPPDQGGPRFDLVIFDEASQVVPEDAVCCIMRGSQLIVVGDNKQLPPTRFFDRLSVDPMDEEEDADLESILDECIETGLQQRMLEWHYRSRQESLIAFSNYHMYGNRLKTFPAAMQGGKDVGIELIHVADGVYDRGGRRDNRNEAASVADLVIQLFLAEPERSLGVVAFSQAQQDAIQDILDYRIKIVVRDRPELERILDEDVPEPFFVKNLENVQGDERDMMIFSVGYGPDEKGEMTMNFGPLNQQGGARRLNVAITRARKGVKVVSSIKADDVKVTNSSPTGVRLLRDYLDYAEARGERVALTAQDADKGRERLEESIAYGLVTRGHLAVRRVGSSAIRVDVAVRHPTEQGRYILGILCDGPSYRECRSVRDREVTREKVLEGLGWKLVRVWSRDWVMDREKVLDSLEKSIKDALPPLPDKK
ncbi:MAG TPA: AAA domain-containing protein, partial [Methanomassiliicoccales archaeon]|nr:AAA domain-containing protein [Methanomassiliicoccales archaeon]